MGKTPHDGRAPDSIPTLTPGVHRAGRGACLMEYVSVLPGEGWSDHPPCTHPALAALARLVNDRVSPAARARLGLLAPALVGTADDDPGVLDLVVRDGARAGLAVRPDDQRLRRVERRTVDRLDEGLGVSAIGRAVDGTSLVATYRRLQAILLGESTVRSDEVRVALLATAVDDVRWRLGRSPVTHGLGWGPRLVAEPPSPLLEQRRTTR